MKLISVFASKGLLLTSMALVAPGFALAHCDTMNGPVIADAKEALDKGNVMPVLKWVKKDDEGEILRVFKETMSVRKKGPEAKGMADARPARNPRNHGRD